MPCSCISLAGHHRNRDRHVLEVFRALLRGDDDFVEDLPAELRLARLTQAPLAPSLTPPPARRQALTTTQLLQGGSAGERKQFQIAGHENPSPPNQSGNLAAGKHLGIREVRQVFCNP